MHLISRKSPSDSPRESCRIRSPDTIVWIPRHIVQLRTGENCCALHAMRTVAPLHPHRNFFHRPLLGFLVCSPWRRIEMLAYLQEFGLGTPRCYDVLYHFSWSGLEAMFFSFCERFQRKRCWIKLMSFYVTFISETLVGKLRGSSVGLRLSGKVVCVSARLALAQTLF